MKGIKNLVLITKVYFIHFLSFIPDYKNVYLGSTKLYVCKPGSCSVTTTQKEALVLWSLPLSLPLHLSRYLNNNIKFKTSATKGTVLDEAMECLAETFKSKQ